MEPEKQSPVDYNHPVAYDAEGRPLYAHPPITKDWNWSDKPLKKNSKDKKLISKNTTPQPISDIVKLKHSQSKKIFPEIDISENEYVISAIERHPIGLFLPTLVGLSIITLLFIAIFNYDLLVKELRLSGASADLYSVIFPLIAFIGLTIIGMYIIYYIYVNNKLFLTNENLIQQIQTGLFSRREKTVHLSNIEDTSFSQKNIIQQIFNHGSIRMTIEANGTLYKFSYISNPKEFIATLNNTIDSYREKEKNNRD
ncbi:MAG TPA: PH domain-containing protein [Candidatus Saccharibacteria bacterium]|nr:PH domain-containing protein [Candidatus Saccharibacteria bacterium]